MNDLIERLRLQAEIGLFDAANTPGHKIVSYDEAATEIERLTAELSAARALLARYEQAPVVGWAQAAELRSLAYYRDRKAYGSAPIFANGFSGGIALIVRPEPSK